MHRLVVMYPQPEDPVKFREYYEGVHSTLGMKVPNVRNLHFSFDVKALPANATGIDMDLHLFCVFMAEWDSEADMYQALTGTPEGQAVLADVPNYASSAFVFHYPIPDSVSEKQ
jgi:uncharacterized protein (TIGR02118 family)